MTRQPAPLRAAVRSGSDDAQEICTPVRVYMTRAELLVLKGRQQAVVERLSHLGRDLSASEHANLLYALRMLRAIGAALARKRPVVFSR